MNFNDVKKTLSSICKKHYFQNSLKKIESAIPDEININIAFLGLFSSGKSTLINELIGKKLLPAFPEPTTAVVTEISKGNKDIYWAINEDEIGKEVANEISIGELANEVMNIVRNKKVQIQLMLKNKALKN